MTQFILSDMSPVLYPVPEQGPCMMEILVRNAADWEEVCREAAPGSVVAVRYDDRDLLGVVMALDLGRVVVSVELIA